MPVLVVALRKESVDRNNFDCLHNYIRVMSLSARRAWIEMVYMLKGPVCLGRSPQGERG